MTNENNKFKEHFNIKEGKCIPWKYMITFQMNHRDEVFRCSEYAEDTFQWIGQGSCVWGEEVRQVSKKGQVKVWDGEHCGMVGNWVRAQEQTSVSENKCRKMDTSQKEKKEERIKQKADWCRVQMALTISYDFESKPH